MRDSNAYRKAAQLMERTGYPSPYSCDNLYHILGDGNARFKKLRADYERMFGNAEWWDKRGDGKFGHAVNRSYRGQRILALCFMAAISESLHR